MTYIYDKVRLRFSIDEGSCRLAREGGFETASFFVEGNLSPRIRRYTEENIAEVIAIGYKYDYFSRRLSLPLLTPRQKQLLCASLVSADLEEDKEYALKRLKGAECYSIDGVYNFRLGELRRRWEGVIDYIPRQFGESSLDDFVEFLVEEGEGTVYLKDGRLYDEGYRLLSRRLLLPEGDLATEILLNGASKVYCFGQVERKTKDFLRKYYRDNVFFC
ncbi:MAG: hypothetical protein IKC37_02775 [Clostridia bacterium]|nr:hypothetical protein [Clostridia bacterium]